MVSVLSSERNRRFDEVKRTNFAQAERRGELARTMLRQSKISEAKGSRPKPSAYRTTCLNA